MEECLKRLETLYPLDPELQTYLLHHVKRECFHASEVILYEGEVCDWIAFLEKGLLKIYSAHRDGSERVMWYHKEGDLFGSMSSYKTGQPSKFIVRTLEEVYMRRIKKDDLEQMFEKFPQFNINARLILEQQNRYWEERVLLVALPPKERLRKLQRDHAWMLKDPRIKDYMLADYLFIDKATLSRSRQEKK